MNGTGLSNVRLASRQSMTGETPVSPSKSGLNPVPFEPDIH